MNKVSVRIDNSQFTVKDLSQLLDPVESYNSKLSVIAHIDCNCFFAQVERNRLGLKIEDPIVCVQWHSLIAVSYAARAFGISRMDKLVDAKLKCPNLIPVHTAVFKIKNDYWEYLDNQAFPNAADHKVSLDPYRRASYKILRVLKSITKYVEKASVDEWYLNLNELVYLKLIELIPDFNIDKLSKDDKLPPISIDLEMKGLLYDFNPEFDIIKDYDDLFIVIGGIVTNEIRLELFDKLRYQTSCGVSNNKKLSKLLSNFKKPDEQTVLLNFKISKFLENFKLDDVNQFGGKIGYELMNNFFGTQSISSIQQNFSLDKLKKLIKDEKLSVKIFEIINGQYKEPLNLNKDIIKSMNSNKNLLNGKNGENFENCKQWLKIFSIDLKQRLLEYNKELEKFNLKPKNITIKVKPKHSNHISKTCQIKSYQLDNNINEIFYKKSLELLKEIENLFNYPLININTTISNFDFVSKQENNILNLVKNNEFEDKPMEFINEGKIIGKNKPDIINIFKQRDAEEASQPKEKEEAQEVETSELNPDDEPEAKNKLDKPIEEEIVDNYKYSGNKITCILCNVLIDDIIEHNDYHFALELNKEINTTIVNTNITTRNTMHTNRPKGNKRRKKDDRQSRLPF